MIIKDVRNTEICSIVFNNQRIYTNAFIYRRYVSAIQIKV